MPGTQSPIASPILAAEFDRLIDFGRGFPYPGGGAAWLDEGGHPDLDRPLHTWITARMAHVYALADLLGVDGARALTEHALAGLTGPLRDNVAGGWFSSVLDEQTPDEKSCYAHAFVVLAASSGSVAGQPGSDLLLSEALDIWLTKFWDPAAAMFVDSWNRSFSRLDSYRGLNANMHAVEALIAASDATGDPGLADQALAISRRVTATAEQHSWRIPEHFDPDWQPMLEHNRDQPDDPFQPYGATIGHGLEWSRLLLHLHATLPEPLPELVSAAVALFDRAVADGWNVDGNPGFVYTTDWDGRPVVRDRMHWVAAEAISAATALHQVSGEERYASLCRTWWEYAETYLMDHPAGSWHHQLDPDNRPIGTVWPGKPDLYHAVQATLIPRLPLTPGLAVATANGLLS
jgi:mannose/cellobiose epimerase-like protein (N-acyl-D-glucosamine 2-epimerase family)